MKKPLFIIIGALIGLLLFILAIIFGTTTIGIIFATFLEVIFTIGLEVFTHKKFAKNPIIRNINSGILYGSIVYFILMILTKTTLFSLLGGITTN